ncbi:hypothetical protein ACTFIW_000940 [Dictyostelium discoideum]
MGVFTCKKFQISDINGALSLIPNSGIKTESRGNDDDIRIISNIVNCNYGIKTEPNGDNDDIVSSSNKPEIKDSKDGIDKSIKRNGGDEGELVNQKPKPKPNYHL